MKIVWRQFSVLLPAFNIPEEVSACKCPPLTPAALMQFLLYFMMILAFALIVIAIRCGNVGIVSKAHKRAFALIRIWAFKIQA